MWFSEWIASCLLWSCVCGMGLALFSSLGPVLWQVFNPMDSAWSYVMCQSLQVLCQPLIFSQQALCVSGTFCHSTRQMRKFSLAGRIVACQIFLTCDFVTSIILLCLGPCCLRRVLLSEMASVAASDWSVWWQCWQWGHELSRMVKVLQDPTIVAILLWKDAGHLTSRFNDSHPMRFLRRGQSGTMPCHATVLVPHWLCKWWPGPSASVSAQEF